tara:strand:- start:168 stop:425 length:258 start_codon:yes stop_codon:yes gene_type:complete
MNSKKYKQRTTWLTKETRAGLKKLDDYLARQPWSDNSDMETVMKTRELITNIEDRGYYDFKEQTILNIIREGYMDEKKLRKDVPN